VLGAGWDLDALRARAAGRNPNVSFAGFVHEVPRELAASDLFVPLCPVEPFGLAILEAMAAGVPVLVPDSGGAAGLVDEGVSGFHFQANQAASLAARLRDLGGASPERLNDVASGARRALATRFSAHSGTEAYRRLLHQGNNA